MNGCCRPAIFLNFSPFCFFSSSFSPLSLCFLLAGCKNEAKSSGGEKSQVGKFQDRVGGGFF